ncbi:hypothetical protein MGWOODY_Mmi468 [hydrothermal vent metagenome]|uniref:Uncharacterized protein n=1 Tax=hydrothermal vent metagenome TaxID=652676 RepID=A0A160VGQ3_9ZZZZ
MNNIPVNHVQKRCEDLNSSYRFPHCLTYPARNTCMMGG